jgi:hypothetical protein
VQFSDTLRLKHNVRRSNCLRDREVGRVDLPPNTSTTRRRLRVVLESAIYVRSISSQLTRTSGDVLLPCSTTRRAVLDVRVRLRQVVKG